jgi:hypothetical protein
MSASHVYLPSQPCISGIQNYNYTAMPFLGYGVFIHTQLTNKMQLGKKKKKQLWYKRDLPSAFQEKYCFKKQGHFFIHECPPWGGECCFFFVFFTYCYLVITRVSIQQGNLVGTYYPLQNMVHLGQGVVFL